MNAEQKALVDRWDAFLAKIHERLVEIMTESEQGLRGLMEENPTDWYAYSAAFTALDHRVRQLRERMEETWEKQVEEKFSAQGSSFFDVGIDRRVDMNMRIDAEWSVWKAKQAGDFYRNLAPVAQAAAAKPVHCTQCASPLQIPDRTISVSINCPACGTINQVSPPMEVTAHNGAAAAYADEETVPLRNAIERFRQDVDRWRRANNWAHEGIANMEKWYAMELDFWTRHAQALARHAGKPVDQALIDARMNQFLKYSLEMDQIWVRAKGKVAK